MSNQDEREQEERQDEQAGAQVRAADDIPEEERVKHDEVDDEEAKDELGETGQTRATRGPWRVAKALLTLREQVNARHPGRSKVSDGTIGDAAHASRSSDHNPWVRDGGNGVVTGMDITHDPAHGCDCNVLAEAIRTGGDARVKYVIWNRQIANPAIQGGAWRPYGGKNPHNHHVHISVKPEKANYDSTAPWAI
ncbi:MAG TPA: hypothetical protein VGV38_12265 [Pyrinomonadaceae bacterium]|nr:hypothetical protein [Pyrinomonadaceae bacterium]